MQRVAEQLLAGQVGSGWNREVAGTGMYWGIWDHLQSCFFQALQLGTEIFFGRVQAAHPSYCTDL